MDFFQARYHGSAQGRFLSPDPAGNFVASTGDPQSWNMYAYARNNPLTLVDPTGLDYCTWQDGSTDNSPETGGSLEGECEEYGGTWTVPTFETTATDQVNTGEQTLYSDDWLNQWSAENGAFDSGALLLTTGSALAPPSSVGAIVRSGGVGYWNCVKNGGNALSMQNALQAATGGKHGNGAIAGALLGNPLSDIISLVQSAHAGKANGAGAVGLDAAAYFLGDAATSGASNVPNFSGSVAISGSLAVTTATMNATFQIGGGVSGSLSLGSAAMSLAEGVAQAGNILNIYNAGVTAVMAGVCAE